MLLLFRRRPCGGLLQVIILGCEMIVQLAYKVDYVREATQDACALIGVCFSVPLCGGVEVGGDVDVCGVPRGEPALNREGDRVTVQDLKHHCDRWGPSIEVVEKDVGLSNVAIEPGGSAITRRRDAVQFVFGNSSVSSKVGIYGPRFASTWRAPVNNDRRRFASCLAATIILVGESQSSGVLDHGPEVVIPKVGLFVGPGDIS